MSIVERSTSGLTHWWDGSQIYGSGHEKQKHNRPEVYGQVGYDSVQNTTMKDVLLHHYPELTPILKNVDRVFAPWPVVREPAAKGSRSPVNQASSIVKAYLPWGE